ncbi:hypothetical protein BC349_14410 [Flavihumibacter stibioxidans]|uniref:FecR family protein n=2 Tax=Flavihumibacter stibioxidans TaxID=1834163 RepID=A0ABR7MBD1_9BACT|nr:hypothetical protein [Flavihumibacter stibioxidans]
MIDELLVKFLLGECTPKEAMAAMDWIEESDANRSYYDHFSLIWTKSREIAASSKVDENAAWERFLRKVNPADGGNAAVKKEWTRAEDGERSKIVRISERNFLFRAAAVLAVIITGLMGYFAFERLLKPEDIQVATTNNTGKTELPDGSNIILNKHSALSYPSRFRGNSRQVKLKGEGFFSIKPNKDKPFIVTVNDFTVTVLGTSFNIRETPDSTVIVVETGIVRVNGKGSQLALRAGEKTTIHHREGVLKKEKQPDQLYNYYRTKTFTCDNTPLWKLVEVLNQAYGANIIIGNPSIRNLPLTTTFNEEPLNKILNIITQTLDISLQQQGDKFILQ